MSSVTRWTMVPRPACALALVGVIAASWLTACTETSLNNAPIIDRSTRAGASAAVVRGSQDVNTGAAAQDSTQAWYVVQKGDTLYHIAALSHCTVQDLARWNGIEENTALPIGQRLRVRPPAAAGMPPSPLAGAPVEPAEPVAAEVHAIAAPVTGALETHALDSASAGAPAAQGASTSAVAGGPAGAGGATAAAASPVASSVAQTGSAESGGSTAQSGSAATTGAAPVATKTAASVPWIWPVEGRVTTTFDPVHSKGIEIAAKEDAKIVAVADGEVSYTGSPREYGNLVIVRHPDGLLSVYAHNKTNLVAQGQAVKRGQAIATAGKIDGNGPSVHFEVRRKGVPVDPMDLLPAR